MTSKNGNTILWLANWRSVKQRLQKINIVNPKESRKSKMKNNQRVIQTNRCKFKYTNNDKEDKHNKFRY